MIYFRPCDRLKILFLCCMGLIISSFIDEEHCLIDKLTIITTTSPIPSNPSTQMLKITQSSLFQIPALRGCKKIIVFDGVPYPQRYRALAYELYIRNVEKLTQENPLFFNTTLVINKEHKHLANSLKEAFKLVETPYVFVHQHDFSLIRPFDVVNLIRSMDENPNLKHIRLNRLYNFANYWDGDIDEVVIGGSYAPLTRTFGWSDNDHFARTDYYRNFVFPKIEWNGPMEWFLHDPIKIRSEHLSYGTYIYGHLCEMPYISHLDGKYFIPQQSMTEEMNGPL
jgi:hypothetical protein